MSTPPRSRLRAVINVPVAEISREDLRLLARFLGVLGVVAVAMGVQMWARVEVRATAVALDGARSAVERAEIERDRLLLERTTLRAPSRLRVAASELALVTPVKVVEVRETP